MGTIMQSAPTLTTSIEVLGLERVSGEKQSTMGAWRDLSKHLYSPHYKMGTVLSSLQILTHLTLSIAL